MTRLINPEKTALSYPIAKPRRNRLTARWFVVDGKLTCKWFVE